MQTFCHDLKPQIRMMLDALSGEYLGTQIVEEETSWIEQMTSNEYRVQHDSGLPINGLLEVDTNTAMLATQKTMSSITKLFLHNKFYCVFLLWRS